MFYRLLFVPFLLDILLSVLIWFTTCDYPFDIFTLFLYKFYIHIHNGADVVEWSRALDVRISDWCCCVSMVRVQIPSREEQKFDCSKI
jgi:hypothetical protein